MSFWADEELRHVEADYRGRKEKKSQDYDEARRPPTTLTTGLFSGRREPNEGDSVADLWSERCHAREEDEACLEASERVTGGFQAHNITSIGCCGVPSALD